MRLFLEIVKGLRRTSLDVLLGDWDQQTFDIRISLLSLYRIRPPSVDLHLTYFSKKSEKSEKSEKKRE